MTVENWNVGILIYSWFENATVVIDSHYLNFNCNFCLNGSKLLFMRVILSTFLFYVPKNSLNRDQKLSFIYFHCYWVLVILYLVVIILQFWKKWGVWSSVCKLVNRRHGVHGRSQGSKPPSKFLNNDIYFKKNIF